ncbi:MAG: hypothetical protein WBC44_22450, partial [Planctomycetaceae bacterium]
PDLPLFVEITRRRNPNRFLNAHRQGHRVSSAAARTNRGRRLLALTHGWRRCTTVSDRWSHADKWRRRSLRSKSP